MFQEKYLPEFDFTETHSISIHQTPAKIFSLVDSIDIRESWLINFLFSLRGLGSGRQDLKCILNGNFTVLEQQVGSEIILGLVGQFWKPQGNLKKLTPDEFNHFNTDGFLKATWNFKATSENNEITKLETETRVKCLGKKAHRKFSFYWFFIRPFSGLIRMEILKLIKKKAEAVQPS
ncbi:MAG: hypothetical protein HOP08_01615 [Cyclobacteriaceae bacterium]|nr:hypothetical protein [Cyclobacteriaceae bacterium]